MVGAGFIDYCSVHYPPRRKYSISLQTVIHTTRSVSLQANLVYQENECTAYLTMQFLEDNEILQFVSFHYWKNQKYTLELPLELHLLTIP